MTERWGQNLLEERGGAEPLICLLSERGGTESQEQDEKKARKNEREREKVREMERNRERDWSRLGGGYSGAIEVAESAGGGGGRSERENWESGGTRKRVGEKGGI